MVKIACIILTLNEEIDIQQCLRQFRTYIDYMLVLDGGSVDDTVNLAKEVADSVIVKTSSGSFAKDKNYAWSQLPEDIDWVLFPDSDEKWDIDFLINMKNKCVEAEKDGVHVFRFPRVNLPDCNSWPDYQLRLVRNSKEFEWRGNVDEVLWWKTQNIPLDQGDKKDREKRVGISAADEYPIVHLKRAEVKRRSWW